MTILQKTSRRGNVPATPTINETLASLREMAAAAIEWGEANLHNPAAAADPRWEHAWWALTVLAPRIRAMEAELARQMRRAA